MLPCDTCADVGARNERHLCAVDYNKTSGFQVIHGLLDRVMQQLGVAMGKGEADYRLQASQGGLCSQSLEFVADMRILAEMKIKNRWVGGGGGGVGMSPDPGRNFHFFSLVFQALVRDV